MGVGGEWGCYRSLRVIYGLLSVPVIFPDSVRGPLSRELVHCEVFSKGGYVVVKTVLGRDACTGGTSGEGRGGEENFSFSHWIFLSENK